MELVVVSPKMKAPIVTMTTPKTTNPCQLQQKPLEKINQGISLIKSVLYISCTQQLLKKNLHV